MFKIQNQFTALSYESEEENVNADVNKYNNIASYLNLDNYLIDLVKYSIIFNNGLFSLDDIEYKYLVRIMEICKNSNCCDTEKVMDHLLCISEDRISKCFFKNDKEAILIYEIYKIFLYDTKNIRKILNMPNYKELKKIINEEFETKFKETSSELDHKYLNKYFELGKRYYAKRNNSKVLLKNYIRAIGKFMILFKKNNLLG